MRPPERVVAAAGITLLVLQAVPLVAVGWVSDGGRAATDALMAGLTSPVLVAVSAFAVVLAVGVARGPQPTATLDRVRWAAGAALAHVAALVGAVVLDGAAASGTDRFRASMDDGSLEWSVAGLVLRSVVIDLRAPLAFIVALVALRAAARQTGSQSRSSPPSPSSPARDGLSGGSGPGRAPGG